MKNILVRVDITTYLFLLLMFVAGYIKSAFLLMLIVLIHELGHVVFFLLFRIKVNKVVIYPFGGITYIDKKIHERIYKDVICSLAGIFFQILLFLAFKWLIKYNFIVNSTFDLFCYYNKIIIIFNLLPIIPLDGSKIFFSLCTKYLAFKKSYFIMILVSFITLIIFIFINYKLKINDVTIYLFLFFHLYSSIKMFKYVYNRFLLERVLYDHYYDKIINNKSRVDSFLINKYYFIKNDKGFINEKNFLKNSYFYSCSKS